MEEAVNATPINRSCGACHACCVHVAVRAFDKPIGEPCHLIQLNADAPESGCCGDYANRPSECQQYTCGWMDGYLPDDMRPDQCGVMFETAEIQWPRRITLLMGWEIEAGAWEKWEQAVALSIPPDTVVGVIDVNQNDFTLCGTPEDIRDYNRFMEFCQRNGGYTARMADGEFEVKL